MSNITAYYIDDQQNVAGEGAKEIQRYAERLSREAGFNCVPKAPPKWEDLDHDVFVPLPDLFLIDYDLSRQQLDGSKAGYRGSTLATEIRARYPNVPIVLITRQFIIENLDNQTKRQLLHYMQVFDDLIFKTSLEDELDRTRELLISLVRGFKALYEITDKNWMHLVNTLRASADESDQLREAAPPLKDGEWTIAEISRWVRNVLLEYPGILYDSVNAATRLGVTEEAFLREDVQHIFEGARYDGIFALSTPTNHWWRARLFQLAQEFMREAGIEGPLNLTFAKAFELTFGERLLLAECVWDCRPIADWVCYILQKPVKYEHTLRYYPDNRPSVMDEARVSFRAVRESNDFQEQLLDSTGAEMVRDIETREDPCLS